MPWETPTIDSQFLAVHAAFMNYDTVLFFGGDEFNPEHAKRGIVDATCLFESGAVGRIHSPTKLGSADLFDAFCSGHALTVNGTLMIAGGTEGYPLGPTGTTFHHEHFPGLRDTAIFRYETNGFGWIATAELNRGKPRTPDSRDTGGRWYPTLLTLGNGDILALSGHPAEGDASHINYIPEVFTPTPPPHGQWHQLGSYDDPGQDRNFKDHQIDHYPRAHLLPSGDVLLVSPTFGTPRKTVTLTVNRNPWSGTFTDICDYTPQQSVALALSWALSTSVLLPLMHERGHAASVLLANDEQPWILNLAGWGHGGAPQWAHTRARKLAGSPRRANGNAVILPTGEILCVGGIRGQVNAKGELETPDSTAVLWPEIYNPFTSHWSALTAPRERATIPRGYHSVALLLRDGRVWTAGSDHNGLAADLLGGGSELSIEIYEPWYYRRKNRPTILDAPDRWLTGETFVVRTTQAAEIAAPRAPGSKLTSGRVVLVRCGSCTHAFNSDQRFITLKFDYNGGNELVVTAPPDGNVSPPGMYFLYTVNGDNLPSDGITLHMSADPETQAEREWDALYKGS